MYSRNQDTIPEQKHNAQTALFNSNTDIAHMSLTQLIAFNQDIQRNIELLAKIEAERNSIVASISNNSMGSRSTLVAGGLFSSALYLVAGVPGIFTGLIFVGGNRILQHLDNAQPLRTFEISAETIRFQIETQRGMVSIIEREIDRQKSKQFYDFMKLLLAFGGAAIFLYMLNKNNNAHEKYDNDEQQNQSRRKHRRSR